jgi:hypothetical protein
MRAILLALLLLLVLPCLAFADDTADELPPIQVPYAVGQPEIAPAPPAPVDDLFAVNLGPAFGWLLDGTELEDSTQMVGAALGAEWKPLRRQENASRDFSLTADAAWMTSDFPTFSRQEVKQQPCVCAQSVGGNGCECPKQRDDIVISFGEDTVNVVTAALNVKVDLAPMLFGRDGVSERLELYAVAGPALIYVQGVGDDYVTAAGNFGIGASFMVTSWLGAQIEADYLLAQNGSDVALAKALLRFEF